MENKKDGCGLSHAKKGNLLRFQLAWFCYNSMYTAFRRTVGLSGEGAGVMTQMCIKGSPINEFYVKLSVSKIQGKERKDEN